MSQGIIIRQGDCRELLKTIPDNSIDSCVTDPPYELSTDGKTSPHRIFVELMFPQHPKIESDGTGDNELPLLVREVARLCLGGNIPAPSSAVPEGSVAFDGDASGCDDDVDNGNESAIGSADTYGRVDGEPDPTEYLGCFALELGDGGDVPVLNALAHVGCAFTTEGVEVGGVHGPSGLRESLSLLTEHLHPLVGDVVGKSADPLSSLVGALGRTEDLSVFRVGAGRGAEDLFSAGGALMFASLAKATGAKLVRAPSTTSGLPAVLESRRIRVVTGATNRALTFDLVVRPQELASRGFMGQQWDGSKVAFDVSLWREVLRVLKPGGHAAVFGAERTFHRLVSALEDAGFEIRAMGFWVSAQSFPKSRNIAKDLEGHDDVDPSQWEGWGTALKNQEPWVLVRKPLEGTIADNVLKYGVGGLYIDGCRLPFAGSSDKESGVPGTTPPGQLPRHVYGDMERGEYVQGSGRWPSAIICSDEDIGDGPAGGVVIIGGAEDDGGLGGVLGPYTKHFRIGRSEDEAIYTAVPEDLLPAILPTGIICSKASTGEREMGCEDMPERWVDPSREEGSAGRDNPRAGAGRRAKRKNIHPTVKPVGLMRHLVRLVTPPGGTVLDPFTGAGSTPVAAVWEDRKFHGFELSDDDDFPYVRIAVARTHYAQRVHRTPEIHHRVPKPKKDPQDQTTFDF